jgi:carbon starvation protein CstA
MMKPCAAPFINPFWRAGHEHSYRKRHYPGLVRVGLCILRPLYLAHLGQAGQRKRHPGPHLADGVDYSPSKRRFLWGNHFASIAGAGPIIGPIVAISFFGWGPTLLWVAIGAVFLGAVHDYLALMMSVRHKGRGISELAAHTVGKPAAAMFAIMLYFVLVLSSRCSW